MDNLPYEKKYGLRPFIILLLIFGITSWWMIFAATFGGAADESSYLAWAIVYDLLPGPLGPLIFGGVGFSCLWMSLRWLRATIRGDVLLRLDHTGVEHTTLSGVKMKFPWSEIKGWRIHGSNFYLIVRTSGGERQEFLIQLPLFARYRVSAIFESLQ